jgi:hypothetical protein
MLSGAGIIRRMANRVFLCGTGLAGILAAAVLSAVPHRPLPAALSSDWMDAAQITLSVFPSGEIYAGERISATAAMETDPGDRKLQLRMDRLDGDPFAESGFSFNNLTGTWQAQLPWVWDSSGQEGWHTLYAVLGEKAEDPGGGEEVLRHPVRILPSAGQPAQRRNAAWKWTQSGCCDYYYLAGTEAERDLERLVAQTETIYAELTERMEGGTTPDDGRAMPKPVLVFLPRMYGQGGLVIREGILTYADRNYTGTEFSVLLKHEMVHLMANTFAGDRQRATVFLQEGLAVFLTGGHYRAPESLPDRAAALIALGRFVPLSDLADSFYGVQHEAAYIEAGSFMEFLVARFGAERVLAMFFDPVRAETPAAAVDAMLRAHFRMSFAECEADWLSAVRSVVPDGRTDRDVEFTVDLFDLIRRYQRAYAPGGSIFDLWLPDPARARAERITADYLPSPEAADPVALELMFLTARESAERGNWLSARGLLEEIGRVLDAKQRRVPEPFHAFPAAEKYRSLAAAILRAGWDPLNVEFLGGEASVEARNPRSLEKEVQHWNLVRGNWARAA